MCEQHQIKRTLSRSSNVARVQAVIPAFTDPISDQPAFKTTPVRVERFAAVWHGFLLTRQSIGNAWFKGRGEKADRIADVEPV